MEFSELSKQWFIQQMTIWRPLNKATLKAIMRWGSVFMLTVEFYGFIHLEERMAKKQTSFQQKS